METHSLHKVPTISYYVNLFPPPHLKGLFKIFLNFTSDSAEAADTLLCSPKIVFCIGYCNIYKNKDESSIKNMKKLKIK